MSKTREEVEALKANWLEDPCFDLASVPGFEEFSSELDQFQDEQKAKWAADKLAQRKSDFEHKKNAILDVLESMRMFDLLNNNAFCQAIILKGQVQAILLLTEQVKRVGDLLAEKTEEDHIRYTSTFSVDPKSIADAQLEELVKNLNKGAIKG